MHKVLFVCMGNICRSPMAEAILRKRTADEGLTDQVIVHSAGLSRGTIDMPPHKGTQKLLKKNKISFEGLKATLFQIEDYETYDWIIPMDYEVYYQLITKIDNPPKERIHLFLNADPKRVGEDVPDPYITGKFKDTYRLISAGCEYWLTLIKEVINEKHGVEG